MAVKPMDDRVLVKPIERESVTSSGLYLPESSKERPVQGKVVSVGPGKLLDNGKRGKMTLKVKDEVYYGKYAGTEVKIDDEDYVILKESDVLAVVEK